MPFRAPEMVPDVAMTAMVTAAAVGALCSLIFAAYLCCKACSEVVEGSQAISVFLLFTFVLCFASVAPFALYPERLVCFARLHAPPMAMSALLAVLLARALSLATADADGLPGHVSGPLTAALLSSLTATQAAVAAAEWAARETPLTVMVVVGRHTETVCADAGAAVLARFIYPGLLLALLLFVSPIIIGEFSLLQPFFPFAHKCWILSLFAH